jgi:hypothetical protein
MAKIETTYDPTRPPEQAYKAAFFNSTGSPAATYGSSLGQAEKKARTALGINEGTDMNGIPLGDDHNA